MNIRCNAYSFLEIRVGTLHLGRQSLLSDTLQITGRSWHRYQNAETAGNTPKIISVPYTAYSGT
jgi:hypothetical protein